MAARSRITKRVNQYAAVEARKQRRLPVSVPARTPEITGTPIRRVQRSAQLVQHVWRPARRPLEQPNDAKALTRVGREQLEHALIGT